MIALGLVVTLIVVAATFTLFLPRYYQRSLAFYSHTPVSYLRAMEPWLRVIRVGIPWIVSLWLMVGAYWAGCLWGHDPNLSTGRIVFLSLSFLFIVGLITTILVAVCGRPRFMILPEYDELWKQARRDDD